MSSDARRKQQPAAPAGGDAAAPGPTTIAVSIPFAKALKTIANKEGTSVAAICDREYLASAAGQAAQIKADEADEMKALAVKKAS